MEFSDAVDLPYSRRQLFELVADVERYPEFLPHWHSVRVLRAEGNRLYVAQRLQAAIVPVEFRSVALLDSYSRIRISADDGPFEHLCIVWDFEALAESMSRVRVHTEMRLEPGPLRRPLEGLFRHASRRLVARFEGRAAILYR